MIKLKKIFEWKSLTDNLAHARHSEELDTIPWKGVSSHHDWNLDGNSTARHGGREKDMVQRDS